MFSHSTVLGLGLTLALAVGVPAPSAIAAEPDASLGAESTAKVGADGFYLETESGWRALPGDILLPFNILSEDGRMVTRGPRPGPAKPRTAVGPGLDLATELARAAIEHCVSIGHIDVGAAVFDTSGRVNAMLEADGGDGTHVFVAARKAIATVAFGGRASSELMPLVQKDAEELKKVTPAMFLNAGAQPIILKGRFVGAIGVSGAHGGQDDTCAKAALVKLAPKLR